MIDQKTSLRVTVALLLLVGVVVALVVMRPDGLSLESSEPNVVVQPPPPKLVLLDRPFEGNVAADPSPTVDVSPAPVEATPVLDVTLKAQDDGTTLSLPFGYTLRDDFETTTVMGQVYVIGPDGLMTLLTEEQARAVAAMEAARTAAEANAERDAAVSVDGMEEQGEADEDTGTQVIAGLVQRGTTPITGAEVAIWYASGRVRFAITNASGLYQFRQLEPGSYEVYLRKPDSPNNRRTVALAEGENRTREDFVVPDLPPVAGQVVSAEDDSGIPEARLEVLRGQLLLGSVTADEMGEFLLFPLEPGRYVLAAQAVGFEATEQSFDVAESGPSQRVTLRMKSAASLRGTVMMPGGGPAAGAWVAIFGSGAAGDPLMALGTRSTDSAGNFSFSLPANTSSGWRVGAYLKGTVPAYWNAPQEIIPGQPLIANIQLGAGATLKGVVVDEDDEPIEGVTVEVSEGFANSAAILQRFNVSPLSVLSDTNGVIELSAVETGSAVLTLAAEGFVETRKSIVAQAGSNDLGRIVMESTDGAKEGRIFGIIVDEMGAPMVNHHVLLLHSDERKFNTTTNSRGSFRIDDLPAGEYTLMTNGSMLRSGVYVTMDQWVPGVKPGSPQLYVLYDFGQSARLKVRNSAGQPILQFRVRAQVRHNGAGGSTPYRAQHGMDYERSYQTATGDGVIDTLLSGTGSFTIIVDGVGTKDLPNETVLVAGQLDLGEVIVGEGLNLTGFVRLQDGRPISGALVSATLEQGNPPITLTGTSDGSGSWRIGGLPAGVYTLKASRAGYSTSTLNGIPLEAGQAIPPRVFELQPAGAIQGRVTGAGGSPLAGIRVVAGGVLMFTNGEGRYGNDSVPAGPTVVSFTDPTGKYVGQSITDVAIVPEQTKVVDAVLEMVVPTN